MKNYVVALLFLATTMLGQNPVFEVKSTELKMDSTGNNFYQCKNVSQGFFEDEKYLVSSNCRGEFGGEISFKDKKSGEVNFCSATCPLIINKLNGNYYLTTSLAHMSGSYGFYEISDPKDLPLKTSDTIYYRDWQTTIGLKPLLRGYGKTILLSFPYKSKIYHIVSDDNETYVAERENAELKKIQTINDFRMYSYTNDVCETKDNHYFAIFQTKGKQGYIEVAENNIFIFTYSK